MNNSPWRSGRTVATNNININSGLRFLKLFLVASNLVLLAGDVTTNPGPGNSPLDRDYGTGRCFSHIPVRISNRSRYLKTFERPVTRNVVAIPLTNTVSSQNANRHLRLCSLNAGNLKSKSADFVCYVPTTGADIVAVTGLGSLSGMTRTERKSYCRGLKSLIIHDWDGQAGEQLFYSMRTSKFRKVTEENAGRLNTPSGSYNLAPTS